MLPAAKRRVLFWTPAVLGMPAVLMWLLRPQAVAVDLAGVDRGAIVVTVSDEGEARVRDVFVVAAPISGLMRRVELEPGDHVVANHTVIARLEPSVPTFLDERSQAEARAALEAAAAARNSAKAQRRRAEAERDFAVSALERLRGLAARRAISQNELDAAHSRAKAAAAAVEEASAVEKVREFEYQQARARLLRPAEAAGAAAQCQCVLVYSPISGSVLRVLQESEGMVQPGTPIVDIGDPQDLEIQVDLLSEDAVRVRPGQRVLVENWGGPDVLHALVRRVEPFAFTKVSALGIEEQRVNVKIDLVEPRERWRRLGHGYRVEPRIVLWESHQALRVPASALFRSGEQWAVFVQRHGRAQWRAVRIGRQDEQYAEVLEGLQVGERVVVHPNDRITAGTRITQRTLQSPR